MKLKTLFHIHIFKLTEDTGHNKYYICRCGFSKVVLGKGGYQPIKTELLINKK